MNERLAELLADEATVGLDASERAELDALLAESPETDPDALARIAAEVALASSEPLEEELPPGLRARIEAQAEAFFAASRASEAARDAHASAPPSRRSPVVRREAPRRSGVGRRFLLAAGWVAAAAGWALVIAGGLPEPSVPPATPATASERLARLEAEAPDLVRVPWSAGGDATGSQAGGEVVWSEARQEGYMRFEGLAANDPSQEQYQLWIFDAARDAAHPVDGGVFDVPADGALVVPIRAHLPIDQATLFAVTVERPGGVVVSSRERIAVLAQVEAS